MKKFLGLFLFAVLVVVLAAVGVGIGHAWRRCEHAGSAPQQLDSHAWLHRELGLTEAQREALAPLEAAYAVREQQARSAFDAANRELARAVAEDQRLSPRVGQALDHLHVAMADLQKASLEHLFEMRAQLKPEQAAKLMRLVEQVLAAPREGQEASMGAEPGVRGHSH